MSEQEDHASAPTPQLATVFTIGEFRKLAVCDRLSWATLTKPLPDFTVPLPCFFPVCLVARMKSRAGATKGI